MGFGQNGVEFGRVHWSNGVSQCGGSRHRLAAAGWVRLWGVGVELAWRRLVGGASELSRKVLPGFVVGHTVEVVAGLELACSCFGWGEGRPS